MKTNPYPLNRTARIAIMISLIVLFFVISPVIIFYTAGYRYTLTDGIISKGSLSVDAKPEEANFYINGIYVPSEKNLAGQLLGSISLKNLAAKNYHVSLELPEHYKWEKEVQVFGNKTTYLRDLRLIKESDMEMELDLPESILEAKLSRDGKFLLVSEQSKTGYQTTRIDLENSSELSIDTKNKPSLSWSGYSNVASVIANGTNESELVFVGRDGTFSRNTLPFIVSEINRHWVKSFIPPDKFVFSASSSIYSLSNSLEELAPLPGGNPWHVESQNDIWGYDNISRSIVKGNLTAPNVTVPTQTNVSAILESNDSRSIIQRNGIILVVKHGREAEESTLYTHSLIENDKRNEWITWSDSEIWSISESGETDVLFRSSAPIKIVTPIDRFGNLLIATENELFAYNPLYAVKTKLHVNISIQEMKVNEEENTVHLLGWQGDNFGLFKLEM